MSDARGEDQPDSNNTLSFLPSLITEDCPSPQRVKSALSRVAPPPAGEDRGPLLALRRQGSADGKPHQLLYETFDQDRC